MLTNDTRIIPVKKANQVKTVTKMENGSLRVLLNSGRMYEISPSDEMFQAFVVWTMLNTETRE